MFSDEISIYDEEDTRKGLYNDTQRSIINHSTL